MSGVGVVRFLVRLLILSVVTCILLIGVAWAFGALWFDFPVSGLRQPLAAAFGLSAVAALVFVRPHWRAQLGVAVAIVLVAAWELTIQSSNKRDWMPQVAEVPYAEIDGDRVVIHNFRNFDYLSKTEFRPRWETKIVQLSNLRAVDFFTNFWGPKLICHTFLSFDFGPDGCVCISVETRMAEGQNYSPIAGLYRQFELYYVIGDERDIVRVRTNYRLEDVYLYRLFAATPEKARALFLDYLKSANELHERPQWYNELTSNCTSNIRTHIKHIGSARPWDWQLLVNGTIAERAYELRAIDTSLPFAELRRLSYIDERARAADRDPAFSRRIREGLPGINEARITPPRDTNRTAKFIVLLYHRFEDRPAELVTTPNDFRAQMKALKDNGISVISMQDLLAWRKGEKAIPSKSAVITIDDEWNSQYYVAWPILKEFGYPFTLFIYTKWVNTGGKSTKIIALAFPYGFHNEVVRKTAKEAGYEMQFTVYGRRMDINVPADQIGRYAIDSLKGDVFKAALDFGTTDGTQPGVETSQLASAAMLTEPLNNQHITEPKPTIKANLASMGDVDPKSVEMRISGFGLVPAVYDPKTKLVAYAFTQKLLPKMYIVILTAKVNDKKVETRWDFTVDRAGLIATDQ